MTKGLQKMFKSVVVFCLFVSLGWGTVLQSSGTAHAASLLTDDTDASMVYTGSWYPSTGLDSNLWYQGTAHSTFTTGDTFTYEHYHAAGLRWRATKSADRGQADVYIDDVYTATVDLYSPVFVPTGIVFDSGSLAPGYHKLEVVHKGTKNASSSGYWVEIDAVEAEVAAPEDSPIRVMPLGDSITHGVDTLNPGAYRNALWNILINRGKAVDFVGVQSNGAIGLGDTDHNGNPGFRIDQIASYVDSFMDTDKPDIVLLQIGTNDILQNDDLINAPSRLSGLIDQIVAKLPANGKLFVAKITPLANATSNNLVNLYNVAVEAVVNAKIANGDPVELVDMNAAIQVPYPPYVYLELDGIHPNATGYTRMAEVWYNAIRDDVTELGRGGNIAPNGSASAGTHAVGFDASHAVDGDTSTYWIEGGGGTPQWLTVDLGEPLPVERVQTQFLPNSGSYQYQVETSTDNVNWSVFANRTGNLNAHPLYIDYGNATARYVRITVTGRSNATYPVEIAEFQVFTTYSESLADDTIEGNNLFGPEIVKTGNRWHIYYGGWLEPGMDNDMIYLSITENLDLDQRHSPAELMVSNGDVAMVNDPSIAVDDNGVWHMLYTRGQLNPNPGEYMFIEQIGYASSTDGIHWTPREGQSSSIITITDPNNIAGGDIVRAARPALLRDGSQWRLWFDGQTDMTGIAVTYEAISTQAVPTQFEIVHEYGMINGFQEFWEPDVHKKADGTYVAVVNRAFNSLYYGESTDGIHFSWSLLLGVSEVGPSYTAIDNPSLIVNDQDQVLGVAFGKTTNPLLLDHDVGILLFDEPK